MLIHSLDVCDVLQTGGLLGLDLARSGCHTFPSKLGEDIMTVPWMVERVKGSRQKWDGVWLLTVGDLKEEKGSCWGGKVIVKEANVDQGSKNELEEDKIKAGMMEQ